MKHLEPQRDDSGRLGGKIGQLRYNVGQQAQGWEIDRIIKEPPEPEYL